LPSKTSRLILLPGLLCDAGLWSYQASHLSDLAQVSIGDLSKDSTVQDMARAVLRAAPEQFALAGLSMGGIVALEIMRQSPDRVTRLALLNTNARPLSPEQVLVWRNRMKKVNAGRFDEVLEKELVPAWLHPDRQQERDLLTIIRQMAWRIGPDSFLSQAEAIITRPDGRASLSQIACPTLVLTGRQDALCPPEYHEEIAAALPSARLIAIERCGHMSTLEQPEAVTAALRHWLQPASPRQARKGVAD